MLQHSLLYSHLVQVYTRDVHCIFQKTHAIHPLFNISSGHFHFQSITVAKSCVFDSFWYCVSQLNFLWHLCLFHRHIKYVIYLRKNQKKNVPFRFGFQFCPDQVLNYISILFSSLICLRILMLTLHSLLVFHSHTHFICFISFVVYENIAFLPLFSRPTFVYIALIDIFFDIFNNQTKNPNPNIYLHATTTLDFQSSDSKNKNKKQNKISFFSQQQNENDKK